MLVPSGNLSDEVDEVRSIAICPVIFGGSLDPIPALRILAKTETDFMVSWNLNTNSISFR